MNYEEKYKQALERAKTLIDKLESNHIKGFIYHIFPQLKESEDERMINGLIAYVRDEELHSCYGIAKWFEGCTRNDIIAWLEKQKGKLDADEVIKWLHDHIQVDTPQIEYNEDGQPLAESFIAHAEARCKAADEVVEKFKEDFEL